MRPASWHAMRWTGCAIHAAPGWSWVTRWSHGCCDALSRQPTATLALDTSSLAGIERTGAAVTGATLQQAGLRRQVTVRGGLVLASGGFNRHPQWRAQLLPDIPASWSPGAPGHIGQAQALALGLGARHGEGALSHAFWARRPGASAPTAAPPCSRIS